MVVRQASAKRRRQKPRTTTKKKQRRVAAKRRRKRMRSIMKRFQTLSPVVVSDRAPERPLPPVRQRLWRELLDQAGAWAAQARSGNDRRFASVLARWLEDQLALERRQFSRDRDLELVTWEMIRFCAARGEVKNLKKTVIDQALTWPTRRVVVTSFFGPRKNPFGEGERQHEGIDLAAGVGTDVFAIAGGSVTKAGTTKGYGQMLEIDHGKGLMSRYAHLSATDLRRGDVVVGGSLIGKSGRSGRVTGPHLHLEVRLNGLALDPLSLVGWRSPR